MRNKFGFTLIELLIVVAIIAILAAIAVPNFLEAQTRAKVSRAKSDLRTMAVGVESYTVDNNIPPREYSTAIDGQLNGQNAGGIMSRVLSTPIAYVTNAFMYDPFINPGDNINEDEKFFTYHNVIQRTRVTENGGTAWFFGGPLGQVQRSEAIAERFGSFYLMSIGPDRSFWNNDPGVTGRGGIVGREYIIYDPTNGSISFGNIIRSQKHSSDFQIEADGQVLGPH